MVPGIAGAGSDLAGGALVLVQFINGDPARPVVTHYTPEGGPAAVPTETRLDASGTVKLGGAHSRVIRNGEAVKITLVGPTTAGPSGGISNGIGTIEIAPTVVTEGMPPGGYSRVIA